MENKHTYTIGKMCKALEISPNAYCTWARNKSGKKINLKTSFYKERIKTAFEDSGRTYGSARVRKQLKRDGMFLSRSYVALLMKELGLKSVLGKKYRVRTTDSDHQDPIADNVLNREFNTLELGRKWVSDITYIRVGDKWNYLTSVIDLADRKVLGCVPSQDIRVENTVLKAWGTARGQRKITNGHIFHSDRGAQYASNLVRELFDGDGKTAQSMSGKGNCWDNAVAESFLNQ